MFRLFEFQISFSLHFFFEIFFLGHWAYQVSYGENYLGRDTSNLTFLSAQENIDEGNTTAVSCCSIS